MTTATEQSPWLDPDRLLENLETLRPSFRFDPQIADWARNYEGGHHEHYRDILRQVRRALELAPSEQVVDIGAVPGHIPALLKKAGLQVEAVDINPARAEGVFRSLSIPWHQVDIERAPMPFANGSRDLVLFCEILEHLRVNPLHALLEIRRVLRPGGHCLLSTPQITPLMRWQFLKGKDFQGDLVEEFDKLETLGHMGHFRIYSEGEVVRMAEHAGLRLVERTSGGKMSGANQGPISALLRRLRPDAMRTQIHLLLTPAPGPGSAATLASDSIGL